MLHIKDEVNGKDIILKDNQVLLGLKGDNNYKVLGKYENYPNDGFVNIIFQKPWKDRLQKWETWGVNETLLDYLLERKDLKYNVYIECLEKNKIYKLTAQKIKELGYPYQEPGWDKQLQVPIRKWEIVDDFDGVDYSLDI